MGYTLSTLKVIKSKGFNVHLIHWDKKKITPFKIDDNLDIDIYPKSNYTYISLKNLVDKINPDLVYVSGWQDKDYLKICYYQTYQCHQLYQIYYSSCEKLSTPLFLFKKISL